MSLSPGHKFERYEIEVLLGSGGMGAVYRARDSVLGRTVAIKTLPEELAAQSEHLKRFDREARCASLLNHPNVVTIFDVGPSQGEGLPYIVMEYVDGRTFREIVDSEGPLAFDRALELVAQAAQGLSKAHAAGIVHRDLKPANLMCTSSGVVKILDFGLAKLVQSCFGPPGESQATTVRPSDITGAHALVGTPQYMSPEQVQGLALDHRTDLWSLGAVFGFLLTGASPFRRDTVLDLMYAIVHREPELLSNRKLDQPVRYVLARALAKDPRDRYASAEAMVAALENPSGSLVPATIGALHRGVIDVPTRLTSFIGREREISEVDAALGSTRLLTLTGPGGTGKTSLAVEAARRCGQRFADGATFVPLASVPRPELVWDAVARALGIETKTGDLAVEVEQRLRDQELLLVLDNFEQLIDGAPMVTRLLEACSDLKVLVTTRVPLRVSGELALPVPPLELPRSDASESELRSSEAVQLFLQRSRLARPGFEPTNEDVRIVGEICSRLDGLPLAIELAAARTSLLSPKALLARLEKRLELLTGGSRDQPERHQTLRAAIDWSYELLEESEKTLFQRLSGFSGGVTLDAAEAIVSALGGEERGVLDGVASLLDKSLLRREEQADGEPRLFMLETIREFGGEVLALRGDEAAFRAAHARYFVDLAERAAPHLTGHGAKSSLERLALEYENIQLALDWYEAGNGNPGEGLRLAVALWRFWLARGPLDEGRQRLERLASMERGDEQRQLRARALSAAGSLAQNSGEFAAAQRMLEESLAIQRAIGDTEQTAVTLLQLGWVYWRYGEFGRAIELTEEGLQIHRENSNEMGVTTGLNSLGLTAVSQGEYPEARRVLREVVDRWESHGDARRGALAATALARAMHRQGETSEAIRMTEEAARVTKELSEVQSQAYALGALAEFAGDVLDFDRAIGLNNECLPLCEKIGEGAMARNRSDLASFQLCRGKLEQAERGYETSLEIQRRLGDKWGVAESLHGAAYVARARGDSVEALRMWQESLSLQSEMSNKQGILDALEGLAGLAVEAGDAETMALLLGGADAQREEIGAWVSPRRAEQREKDCCRAIEILGSESFDALRQKARIRGVAPAVERALAMSI